MTSEDSPNESLPAQPLQYRAPRDELIGKASVGGGFGVGSISAVVLLALVGFWFGVNVFDDEARDTRRWHAQLAAIVFVAIGLGGVTLSHRLRKRQSTATFWIGFTCGAGLMALVDGYCFFLMR